jgi:glycosyltransferase involved in cell wall biosynthesis
LTGRPPAGLAELSVFFPVYNEAENVGGLVRRAIALLPGFAQRFEIIAVDDGSSDATADVVEELAHAHPEVRLVRHERNRGSGAALRTGFASARYANVLFTDGDVQFDIGEVGLLVPLLNRADIVAGYRIKRRDPFHRALIARLFNLLVRRLFGLKHRDVNCAFKLVKKKVLNSITLTSDAALINAELLIKARQAGFRIVQTGVNHYPRRVGTQTGVHPLVILRTFREVLSLWRELEKEGSRTPGR